MAFPIRRPTDIEAAPHSRGVLRAIERNERGRAPHIVALGGGTGLPAVLEGLAELAAEKSEKDPYAVTGIVTVTDDGGSSGFLRQQLGILPPGDARNCLLALIDRDSRFRSCFSIDSMKVRELSGTRRQPSAGSARSADR
jgi:2-phospho-L-lactate transferase/gluconeogenesis factor (CofD/UPF0052 family)